MSTASHQPLGLTARQAQVMDAFLRLGNAKLVARELGIAHNTVRNLLAEACTRMQAANRVVAAVEWYRATIGSAAATSPPAGPSPVDRSTTP